MCIAETRAIAEEGWPQFRQLEGVRSRASRDCLCCEITEEVRRRSPPPPALRVTPLRESITVTASGHSAQILAFFPLMKPGDNIVAANTPAEAPVTRRVAKTAAR
jgi:hypothetical protein